MADDSSGVKIWITYELKDGVSPQRYREWSRAVDQPAASAQPGVREYQIYEVEGAEDGRPWADVVEVIEADSWEAWQAVDSAPEMAQPVAEFWDICKPESVKVLYGRRIEP
jgi:hypothetical protein